MELREQIVAAINAAGQYSDENDFYTDAGQAADAILAIPEIRDALAFRAKSQGDSSKTDAHYTSARLRLIS